jgi:hypothetical protein
MQCQDCVNQHSEQWLVDSPPFPLFISKAAYSLVVLLTPSEQVWYLRDMRPRLWRCPCLIATWFMYLEV